MKKISILFLSLVLCAILLSCSSTGSTFTAFADIPSYLTKAQKTMIKNLKMLDKEGHLYQLDYTEDYQLTQVVNQAASDVGGSLELYIRNLMSPNSKYKSIVLKDASSGSAFFTKTKTGDSLVSANHDGTNVDNAVIVVKTAPAGGFKSVGLTDMSYMGIVRANLFSSKGQDYLLDVPFYTVDGVNETGFAVSAIVAKGDSGRFEDTDERPNLPSYLVVRCLLDTAENVDSAVSILNSFDIVPDADGTERHFLMSDSSGKAAVVEIVNGKISLIKTKNEDSPLAITNYFLTPEVSEEKEGLWRKRIMDLNLATNSGITEAGAMDILSSVKCSSDYEIVNYNRSIGKNPYNRANLEKITSYSVVYNVNKMQATVSVREDYVNTYNIVL